jgi:glycosyl transferase, family 25
VIPVYVINLARSPERRAWMEAELARADVEAVFVRAVDGHRFGARCGVPSRDPRPSKAEAALTLSHRKAWRALLASESLHAIILEDDVHLGRGFREMLEFGWDGFGFDAVKLETMLYKVWVSRRGEPAGERRLHRLGTEHLGSAAYVISRAGARKMLAETRGFRDSIDWTLFGRQAIGEGLIKAFQLVPAVAVQDNLLPDPRSRLGLGTTLHEEDRKRVAEQIRHKKPRGPERWRREAHRLVDQIWRWIRLAPTMRRRRIPWE